MINANNGKVVKVRWTADEDSRLHAAVSAIGARQWKTIAEHVVSRNHVQCRQRWEKIAPGRVKGAWSWEEDSVLVKRVNEQRSALGPGCAHVTKSIKWPLVAVEIPGRNAKQCKHRYCTQLDPTLKKGDFTREEKAVIDELAKTMGRNWAQMSAHLPGRTPNMIKNYFKRQERKGRGKTGTPKRPREEVSPAPAQASLGLHTSLRGCALPPAVFAAVAKPSAPPPSVSPLEPFEKKAKMGEQVCVRVAIEGQGTGAVLPMAGKCIATVCDQLDELLDAVEQHKGAQGKDELAWLDSFGDGDGDGEESAGSRDNMASLSGSGRDSLLVEALNNIV